MTLENFASKRRGKIALFPIKEHNKGRFQKRFSGFCPLTGGGYPPFPLSFFEHNDCPLRGGGGTPQFR